MRYSVKNVLVSIAIYLPVIIVVDTLWPMPFGWQLLRAMAIGGSVGLFKSMWDHRNFPA